MQCFDPVQHGQVLVKTAKPSGQDGFFQRGYRKGVAMLLAAGCSMAFAQSPELKTLDIGVGPGWAAGGHAIIAKEKGFFQEEGLETVNLKVFPAGMMQLEGMVSGAVKFANATQAPLLTLRSNRLPVVVLSSLAVADRTTGLLVRKSANVKQPKQLEGLKLGLLKGSPAEQMLQLICEAHSVDCAKIEVVNLPPPAQLASLASGVIDGMVTWQPWIHKAQQEVQADLLQTGTESRFEDSRGRAKRVDFTRSVLASTQGFVDSHPNTVKAVLRAYLKAQRFVERPENYDEVVALYSAFFNDDPALNQVLLKENRNTLALDADYEQDLAAVAGFLEKTGRLRRPVDIKELTVGAPLAELAPALVNDAFKNR